MHNALRIGTLVFLVTAVGCAGKQADKNAAAGEPKLSHSWRSLPLIKNGQNKAA